MSSAWGNVYEGRTDTTGRIMRAVEKAANKKHVATQWTDEDDDILGELEREVIDIVVDDRLPGYQALGAKCAELENKLDEVTSRAERAEVELRRIMPYTNHTEFCSITNWRDGDPIDRHMCDCGFSHLARDWTP